MRNIIHKMPCDTLYTIFFILVVVNFFPGSMGNRFMGGLAWLLSAGLLIWFVTGEYNTFSKLYLRVKNEAGKKPVKSVCWFLFITGAILSLSVNAFRLDLLKSSGWMDFNENLGVILMLSAVACYSFIFIAYFMFQFSRKHYAAPALVLMGLVHLVSVWQFVDYDSSAMMLAYTVARDALNEPRIMSVFRNTTSYGPFAAVVAIYFWGRFMAGRDKWQHGYVDGLIALLATVGCFMAGSRTGIVALFAGLAVLIFYVPARKKTVLIALGIIAVISLHVLAVYHPKLGKKMGQVFPYVNKITQPQTIEMNDFVPDLTAGYAGRKVNRWIRIKEAAAFWTQQPLVGIGLGQLLGSLLGSGLPF